MADLKKLAETLTGLTVLEVNELKTILRMSTASSQLLLQSLLPVLPLLATLPQLKKQSLTTRSS